MSFNDSVRKDMENIHEENGVLFITVDDKDYLTVRDAEKYVGGRGLTFVNNMVDSGVVITIMHESPRIKGPRTIMVIERDSIDTYMANYEKFQKPVSDMLTSKVRKRDASIKDVQIDQSGIVDILNVPLKDLIVAYKRYQSERLMYTIDEVSRMIDVDQKALRLVCKLGYVTCNEVDDTLYISENGIDKIRNMKASNML